MAKQPELARRVVLTRYWVGDEVYHVSDNARGVVLGVNIETDRFVPRYRVVFNDAREDVVCEEMELRPEPDFSKP